MIAAIVCTAGCRQIFGLHELAAHDAASDVRPTGDGSAGTNDSSSDGAPGLDGPTAAVSLMADTYLSNYPSTTTLNYGPDPTVHSGSDPAGTFRALLRFDVSSLAGKTVNAAEIDVYVTTPATSAVEVDLYQVTQAWDESTTTWLVANASTNPSTSWLTSGANPPKSCDTTILATATTPQQTGLLRIALDSDGVAVINSWITGSENDGFVIATSPIGSWQFASKENTSGHPAPALVVAY